jgi:hypothetical protein
VKTAGKHSLCVKTAGKQFTLGDEQCGSEHVAPILPREEIGKKEQLCQIWKRPKKFPTGGAKTDAGRRRSDLPSI